MDWTDSKSIATLALLFLGTAGIIAINIFLGMNTVKDPDTSAQTRINLGIMAAVTGIIIFIFGGAAYMYFSANVNYLTPFLLIMTFVNLFLSLFATSAASLQIVSA